MLLFAESFHDPKDVVAPVGCGPQSVFLTLRSQGIVPLSPHISTPLEMSICGSKMRAHLFTAGVAGDGHCSFCRRKCPLALVALLGAPDVTLTADSALGGDMPAVPVSGDNRDFA